MNMLQHLSRGLRQYREFNAAWTELQRMTDGQLAKLGAERGDITCVAYERAEQRAGDGRFPGEVRQGVVPLRVSRARR